MVDRSASAAASRNAKVRKRRVLPAEVRVDDLMAAAADLFIARGIDVTTVDDIAAKAGVGKGTFYHYFDTKWDVIVALRDRFTAEFVARADAAVVACPLDDHTGRLSAWLSGAIETYLDRYELHDIVFHDFTHSQRRSREKDAVIAQLVLLLEDGERAGVWSFPNARMAAIIVFDGMHGVVDDAIASGQRDPNRLVKLLGKAFSSMLKA